MVRNGYLYVLAYDDGGVYKINLSNSTDITLLSFGFTSEAKSICTSGSCEARLLMVKDLIIGYDFMIDANDNVIQTYGGTRTNNLATPLFCYKEFVMGWGGSYGNEYRYNYLLTPYLATISNLSQAVVKNADKTMKITYFDRVGDKFIGILKSVTLWWRFPEMEPPIFMQREDVGDERVLECDSDGVFGAWSEARLFPWRK